MTLPRSQNFRCQRPGCGRRAIDHTDNLDGCAATGCTGFILAQSYLDRLKATGDKAMAEQAEADRVRGARIREEEARNHETVLLARRFNPAPEPETNSEFPDPTPHKTIRGVTFKRR